MPKNVIELRKPLSDEDMFKSHSADGKTNETHNISIESLAFAKPQTNNNKNWNLPKRIRDNAFSKSLSLLSGSFSSPKVSISPRRVLDLLLDCSVEPFVSELTLLSDKKN